jgi:hypothetical protein
LFFPSLTSLYLCSGEQITVNLWGSRALDFDGSSVRELGKTEPVIVIFVGTLVKMYEGWYICFIQTVYMLWFSYAIVQHIVYFMMMLRMLQVVRVLVAALPAVGILMKTFLISIGSVKGMLLPV